MAWHRRPTGMKQMQPDDIDAKDILNELTMQEEQLHLQQEWHSGPRTMLESDF